MKAKGSWWWMGIFLIFLLAMPSFVRADVTIDTAETSMVDLEDRNVGTGRNAYVTDTGSVIVTGDPAILVTTDGWSINISGSGSVSSNQDGIYFSDYTNLYDGTVTNYGTINGSDNGIIMDSGIVTNYGQIIGGSTFGINFNNDDASLSAVVTNYDSITGSSTAINVSGNGTATITNSGSISGYSGIQFSSDDTLTTRIQNNVGGSIYGSDDAINYSTDGAGNVQITNAGEITGENGNGIYLYSAGPMTATITNTGRIQSTTEDDYEAIYIEGGDEGTASLINSGQIWSYGIGVTFEYLDSATLTNSGQIYSDINYGAYVYGVETATINNNAGGYITTYLDSLNIDTVGDITVNNAGPIYSSDSNGIYIYSADSATVTNSGLIEGLYSYGNDGGGIYVYDAGAATVNNLAGGRIYADNATGVYMESVGDATINNAGLIQGYYSNDYNGGGVAVISANTATVNNLAGGQIIGSNAEGIYMEYIDTATVDNAGMIYGYMDGIGIEYVDEATITNSGVIQSGYNDYDYAGVYISETVSATVNNLAGGIIVGDDDNGIYMDGVHTATVDNAGTIRGYLSGISIYGMYEMPDDDDDFASPSSATVTNSGTIQSYYDGVYITNLDEAKVTNNTGGLIQSYEGRGVAMEFIGNPGSTTAEVVNSGTIQALGYHDEGGYGDAVYTYNADAVKVTNNAGGLIQSQYGYGVGIVETGAYQPPPDDDDDMVMDWVPGPVDVTNSGTIQAYLGGVGIASAGAVTVTNNQGGIIQGGLGYMGSDDDDDDSMYTSGVGIIEAETIDVTNKGTITGFFSGVAAFDAMGSAGADGIYGTDDDVAATITVTNSGTIQGVYTGVSAYFAQGGLSIEALDDDDDDLQSTITVTNSGTISGGYTGVGAGFADIINVTNEEGGTIQQLGDSDGYGVGIMYGGQANVTNAGLIQGYRDGVGITMFGEVNVTNTGTIQGFINGVGIVDAGWATVENSGLIQSLDPSGVGVRVVYAEEASVINNAGGLIQGSGYGINLENVDYGDVENYGNIVGYYGIYGGSGNVTIDNYGTVTGTDAYAIYLNGDYNQVTLHTGSVINGIITTENGYTNNSMILDGEGTIRANQMQGFGYLNKTGEGTWTLTGDMDYALSYGDNGHQITVEEGTLALAQRGTLGVVTDYYVQNEGASLGYVVSATGETGGLTSYQTANFDDGQIVVIPTAGTYAPETLYENVLNLSSAQVSSYWGSVVSTSAFLSPEMIDIDEDSNFDLALTRLSFTTGMPESLAGFGAAMDALYDTATGDMRTFLDELIVLSPEDAAAGMASASGATQTAMQRLSFSGLGNYLGVINNHLSGGAMFARNTTRTGMAFTPYTQMALAGGGETLSDATPLLLAAVGSVGQGPIASGTRWGLWVDGYFSYGDRRSDDIITKYNQKLYGGMLGFDVRVTDNFYLGISGGISTAKLNFDDLEDDGKMNSYQGSLYACYNGMPWYAAGIFTFAYNQYDFDRYITFAPGLIAKSDYDGREYVGYAEVGYKFNPGGVIIRPSVAFQVDYLTLDAFTETGAGMYNLAYDENNVGSYQSFLGVSISGPIKLGASAVLTPELRLKWAHEFSNDENLIQARLAGSGSGSSWWSVEAEELSRDSAIVGVGLNMRFTRNLSAYLQYDAELNSDLITHTGLVGLRLEW